MTYKDTISGIIFIMVCLVIAGLMELSMTKDSKIQRLQLEVDQIPNICIEQFGG